VVDDPDLPELGQASGEPGDVAGAVGNQLDHYAEGANALRCDRNFAEDRGDRARRLRQRCSLRSWRTLAATPALPLRGTWECPSQRAWPGFGDNRAVHDPVSVGTFPEVPRIPASAGSLIFDEAGRLLILKPNYKKGWTIPGGQIDPDGESPWEACRRETLEECGLKVEQGRLVCVDFLRPKANRPGGVRFLFDCGTFSEKQLRAIKLEDGEIDEHRFVTPVEATGLLSGPLRRRVSASVGTKNCVYLENGRPVPGVQS
jgi:8-oxo-dGTP diphosphatase